MSFILKKLASGAVQIASNTLPRRFSGLPTHCQVKVSADVRSIEFWDSGKLIFNCLYTDIAQYEISPAAAVTINHNALTIFDFVEQILLTSFFFELANGQAAGAVVRTGEATGSIVATPTHNLVVSGIENASIIRLTSTAAAILSGIVATSITKQQFFTVINESASASITFPKENVNSSANNRFMMVGTSRTLASGAAFEMMYDLSINRFRILN